MKSNDWRHKNVARYTPGNTKILYFFNCLLDGMHTKRNYICDFSRGGLDTRLYTRVSKPCSEATNIVSFIYCGLCFGWARKNAIYFGIICKFVEESSLTVKGNSEIIFEKFEEGDWRYRIFKK